MIFSIIKNKKNSGHVTGHWQSIQILQQAMNSSQLKLEKNVLNDEIEKHLHSFQNIYR